MAIGTAVAASMLVAPASAFAVTAYVAAPGAGTMDCSSPANACATVAAGITYAGANGTVDVESGTYPEAVTLLGGQSLTVSHFNGGITPPVIDGGASPAVTVATAAGTIAGFGLLGDPTAVQLNAPATLMTNVFGGDATSTGPDVQVSAAAAGSTVTQNVFSDPDTTDDQIALEVINGNAAMNLSSNSFTGFNRAILIEGGTPKLQNNVIAGTHDSGIQPGAGIVVASDANPTLEHNTISSPGAGGAGGPIGIWLQEDTITPADTGASITRDLIFNMPVGIRADDTKNPVTVFSTIVGNSTVAGIEANDQSPTGVGQGNITVRNSTVAGVSGKDLTAAAAQLSLDSTLVGSLGISVDSHADCDIVYSRGPVKGAGNCKHYSTTAAPRFRNSAGNDFHLRSTSAMIDAGNPASPGVSAKDVDGNNRSLDGNLDCASRRDIGADEFVPSGPCTPPHHPNPKALTRVTRHGLDFSFRIGSKRGGNYNLCVNGPPVKHHKSCRGFSMRRVGPHHYVDVVKWSTHFGFKGPGGYTVSWRKRSTGKSLGPRREFNAGVCPPANQSMMGVWKPSRLHITSHCATVSGTVLTSPKVTKHDQDLTFHFTGPSLIEFIPRDKGHTRRGSGTGPHNPRPGDHLRLTGVTVCDTYHGPRGHTEMHPTFKVQYIRNGHVAATYVSGPQYGGTPRVGLPILGPFPC